MSASPQAAYSSKTAIIGGPAAHGRWLHTSAWSPNFTYICKSETGYVYKSLNDSYFTKRHSWMWKSQTFCVGDRDVFLQGYLKWLSSRIYYYGSSIWYNEEFDCSTDAMKTADTQGQHSTNLSPKKTTINRSATSTWQTTSHMGGVTLLASHTES